MKCWSKTMVFTIFLCFYTLGTKAQDDIIPLSVETACGFWTMAPIDADESGIMDLEKLGFFISYTDWFQLGMGVQRRASAKTYVKYYHLKQEFKYLYGAFYVESRFRLAKVSNFEIRADMSFLRNRVMEMRYWLNGEQIESLNWHYPSMRYFFSEFAFGPYIDYTIGDKIQLYSSLYITRTFVSWRGTGRSKEDEIQVDPWYVTLLAGIRLLIPIKVPH